MFMRLKSDNERSNNIGAVRQIGSSIRSLQDRKFYEAIRECHSVRAASPFNLLIYTAEFFCYCTIASKPIRYDFIGRSIPRHHFFHELPRCFLIPIFGGVVFQHLALIINCTPQVISFSIYIFKNFIKMLLTVARLHTPCSSLIDLTCELRAKPVPLVPNRFIAYIYSTLIKQIFYIPQ